MRDVDYADPKDLLGCMAASLHDSDVVYNECQPQSPAWEHLSSQDRRQKREAMKAPLMELLIDLQRQVQGGKLLEDVLVDYNALAHSR